MTRTVLLDTNILIGALDGEVDNDKHQQARAQLDALLDDPDVRLALTPLVRYEFLRGAQSAEELAEWADKLDKFETFDIRDREALLAADVFRHAREQSIKLDKRAFDLFHCISAELNHLELASQDPDIQQIQQLIEKYKESVSHAQT
jgi:predicted nucleic acid-binding protein